MAFTALSNVPQRLTTAALNAEVIVRLEQTLTQPQTAPASSLHVRVNCRKSSAVQRFKKSKKIDVTADFALQAINAAENLIGENEIKSNGNDAIKAALASKYTFYDCEFAVAAKSLSTILVTEDKALLKAFPGEDFTLANALAHL